MAKQQDPYSYPGTHTLINLLGIEDAERLNEVEAGVTYIALSRVVRDGVAGDYDYDHLRAFHRAIFGQVYPWAGETRTVDISKPGSDFGNAGHVEMYIANVLARLQQENCLRDLERDAFVDRFTYYFAEVNSVHPFREGNGRAQRAFFGQLAEEAGYRVAWELMDKDRNIEACRSSHNLNNDLLGEMLDELVEPLSS